MISTSRTSDFQISGSAISSHKNIQLRYKTTRQEDAPFDLLVKKSNFFQSEKYRVQEFDPTGGSDERQYCSPGFDLPMGQMARLVYGEYPEYHTSLDTKEVMGIQNIMDSANQIERFLLEHEREVYYLNCFPNGELKLGNYDLYPTLNVSGKRGDKTDDIRNQPWFISCVMFLLNYGDGRHPLSYVAMRTGVEEETILKVADILTEKKLIQYL